MNSVAISIAPIFLLVAFGYLLRRRDLFSISFWDQIERLVFYFLFPALLISNISSADLAGLEVVPIAAILISSTLLIGAAAVWIRPKLGLAGTTFVSAFQGITRPNTYLGLSTAAALYGETGIALIAVCIVAVIPLVNFLAVVSHLRWAHEGSLNSPASWKTAVKGSCSNPVIVACLLGAALNLSGIGLPVIIGPFLILIGKAALPLGLMAVGAGLQFEMLGRQRKLLIWTTTVKLLVAPCLTWAICVVFGIDGITAAICVIFSGLPVSATSYVMARQMGGDGSLMASIVTATTIASAFTLPIIIAVFY